MAARFWLADFWSDLRYAMRGLSARPAFAAAVIATFALGIGANAAIFSVVDRLLFRAPPLLREPALTHRAYFTFPMPDGNGEFVVDAVSFTRFTELTDWTRSFSKTALVSTRELAVGEGAEARERTVGVVSASFFDFFAAPPTIGRYFSAQEDQPPLGTPVVVLSHATWQTRYQGRSDVVGATLRIGATVYTVIGVAPAAFAGLWPEQPPIAFLPVSAVTAEGGATRWWTSRLAGELLLVRKPEVAPAAATDDLTSAAQRSWEAEGGAPDLRPRALVGSVLTERGPNQTSMARMAALVGGMALVVLLIATANVANLLLARALSRKREIAIRLALGASRRRLLSQPLAESLLLAALGGLAGLAAAQWGGAALRAAFLPPGASSPVVTDLRTLIFAGIAVVMAGTLTALAPIGQTRRAEVMHDLRVNARDGGRHQPRVRMALLVLQCALALPLLVAAGLFVASLQEARHLPLGFDPAPVLAVNLNMRGVRLDSVGAVALRNRLLATAQRIPGVDHAALTLALPFYEFRNASIEVPDSPPAARDRFHEIYQTAVTPDYFATVGTRILRGRGIESGDVAGAPGAAVVSRSTAELLWPGRDALGQCVKVFPPGRRQRGATAPCSQVVGVAEDIRNGGFSGDPGFYYYVSAAQLVAPQMLLVARVRGDAARQVGNVRRELQREMPGASYVTVTPFAEIVERRMRPWQVGVTMFVTFGLLALILAAVGLYAVIAYDVAQRSHEVGLRIALGAPPSSVVWRVVRQGTLLAALGIAIGAGISLLGAGRLAPLLFVVSARDPLVYALVAATMLAVAVTASFIPARRAAGLDPNVTLRFD